MFLDLLVNPDRFFRQQAADPRFRGPAAVMFVYVVVAVASSLVTVKPVMDAMPAEVGAFASFTYVVTAVGAAIGTLIFWLVYAGVFYLVSMYFGGTGRFTTTLKLVAWGFFPAIFAAVVSSAALYSVFQGIQLPADPTATGQFVSQLMTDPLVRMTTVVGFAFTLWQAFLWTFAVRYARDIDLRQAAITVGIPVGLMLVWNVLTFLGVGL
ncbi:Yip1 family protein [Halobacteriaceae archaeon GCM10025711]